MRVQLKNDKRSDGEVVAKGAAKAYWRVKWTEGPHKPVTTDQHSKSLRAWELDLSAIQEEEEESESEDEAEEVTALPEVDWPSLKRKFAAHSKTLVGKKEVVRSNITFFIYRE